MKNDLYKEKVSKLISKAKEKGLIKKYSEYCQTEEMKQMALSEEESKYYITKNEEEKKKYNIGDIVFVSNYKYKSGLDGNNHSFVIIDESKAIDINYFGFLLSSKVNKADYSYNEILNKNKTNNLLKDSIVKCDDLIEIQESKIKFKIGEVSKDDLEKFVNTYSKYIDSIKL
ncbi:MAG: type II toxin-antitoxin system PemK/MazF family toxin [Clostridia bacterium]|nr:type II toxin-antitoxin system PemK/MazF family toxin [Clostridia bacterium]